MRWPPRERIAESLAEQVLGTCSSRRSAHSVLNTLTSLPPERSITATCPWYGGVTDVAAGRGDDVGAVDVERGGELLVGGVGRTSGMLYQGR
jgi:hypothetical protein